VFDWLPTTVSDFDTVADFTGAQGDKLVISGAVFTGLSTGFGTTLAATSLALGTVATTTSAQLVYDSASGDLSYDADGTGLGALVKVASITGNPNLTNLDFLLV